MTRFLRRSREMSRWFTVRANRNVNDRWTNIAEKHGLPTVRVEFSRSLDYRLAKIAEENVNLIKSIPAEYFDRIQDAVTQSQRAGNDLELLYKKIMETGKVTKNRAEFIARDQNAKATSFIARQRELDMGITRGIWMHSRAAIHPRPGHLKADGKKFDLDVGLLVDNASASAKKRDIRYTFPGQEISCGCTHRPIIVIGDEEYD
jgi:uncharacterized protein with gpF-like domain